MADRNLRLPRGKNYLDEGSLAHSTNLAPNSSMAGGVTRIWRQNRRIPSLLLRPHGKPDTVGCHQPRNAVQVDLSSVLGCERRHPDRIKLAASSQIGDLVEELLEAGRRDDLENARRRVACIPKRVPLAARLEDQVAHLAIDELAAQVGADSSLEDKAVLILATVPVQRCRQCAWLHRVFNKRETPARLSAIDHEPNADPSQFSKLSALRTHDPSYRRRHFQAPFQ